MNVLQGPPPLLVTMHKLLYGFQAAYPKSCRLIGNTIESFQGKRGMKRTYVLSVSLFCMVFLSELRRLCSLPFTWLEDFSCSVFVFTQPWPESVSCIPTCLSLPSKRHVYRGPCLWTENQKN